jgi:hypothetical protein
MSDNLVGSAGPDDAASDSNSLKFLVQQELAKINTATLVKIVKAPYDAEGNPIPPGTAGPIGFIDVQPLVNQLDGSGNATPHGTVYKLSYMRYQGAQGSFISDPVVGDIGKMVIANRDTSSVRATGAQANPGSRRKFNMADGTYFGQTQAGTPQRYVSFTDAGIVIAVKSGEPVKIIGDLHVTGAIIAGFGGGDQVGLQTHTHNQGNDSHGDAEVPTNAPNAGS